MKSLSVPFRWALAVFAAFRGVIALAGLPVTENFPSPISDYAGPVPAIVPTAKALVIPLTAYDPDGHRLNYTATSSNSAFMVRVRTGNPLLKMTLLHAGASGDPTDPGYPAAGQSGDLVFQLFRHLTPQTAGFIAGFAQAGFYDGTKFHRLADLNASSDPTAPPPDVSSFIYQGGDPLSRDPIADPSKLGQGGPSFSYDNEQDASLIFVGRGQLAMANSGLSSTFQGSNGSQFFITDGRLTVNGDGSIAKDGRPRFLDFSYTVFGQMTHGWDLLDNLKNTPRWPNPPNNSDGSAGTPPTNQQPDAPKVPVSIAGASVVDQYQSADGRLYTDAVLIISFVPKNTNTPRIADIAVTVSDSENPANKITQTFRAVAVNDTMNDHPIIGPLSDRVAPKNKRADLPFEMIDLERDFVTMQSSITNTSSSSQVGFSGVIAKNVVAVLGNPSFQNTSGPNGYTGALDLDLNATQFDMTYRGTVDGTAPAASAHSTAIIAVGQTAFTPEAAVIQGAPNAALTNVVVAKFQTGDTRAQAGDISAVINWGDGSTTSSTTSTGSPITIANFPASAIVSDGGSLSRFQVQGTHTYTRKGIYPVLVTFTNGTTTGKPNTGLNMQVFSTAVITAGPLHPTGRTIDIKGRNTGNQILATFTDTSGVAGAVSADIDWGDGLVTKGTVRTTTSGVASVSGSHTYQDAETFPVLVHLHKQGDSDPTHDVSAWSTLKVSGFTGQQHLPPFDQAHLVAEFSPVVSRAGDLPIKSTVNTPGVSQTYLAGELVILNSGNVGSKMGHLRLFLSPNKTVDLTPSGSSTNPADIPLLIGRSHHDAIIPAIPPGVAIKFTFDLNKLGDFRLIPAQIINNAYLPLQNSASKGDVTSGANILAYLDYSDPVADNEPISRAAVFGPMHGVLLNGLLDSGPSLSTSEDAGTPNPTHSASFNVRLDRKPSAAVNIAFTVSNTNEGSLTLSPPNNAPSTAESALSSVTVTFTPDNWNKDQPVWVTGVPDATTDNTQTYSISGAVTSTDPFFDNMPVSSVSVSNKDSIFLITPLSITAYRTAGVQNTATFTVALAKMPTTNVTLPVVSSNPNAGTVSPGVLTFNPTNFATPQVVTVTAIDTSATGNQTYQIMLGPVPETDPVSKTGTDPRFSQDLPASVTVTNRDDPFVISPAQLTVFRAPGGTGTASFNISLTTAPTDNVFVPVSISSADSKFGSINQSTLLFSPTNYATPQTVTVTAASADTVTSDSTYKVSFGAVFSNDTNYNGAVAPPVTVTNTNNPIVVSPLTLTTTEAAGPDHAHTFTVTLSTAPTAPVTISVTSLNTAEGTVDQSSLTFTPDNYSVPQTVTVTAVDDGVIDGTQSYGISLGQAQSTDPKYNGLTPRSVTVFNLDAEANP